MIPTDEPASELNPDDAKLAQDFREAFVAAQIAEEKLATASEALVVRNATLSADNARKDTFVEAVRAALAAHDAPQSS